MMSLTFGLFTQVSGSGPLGPLVWISDRYIFVIIFLNILFIFTYIYIYIFIKSYIAYTLSLS